MRVCFLPPLSHRSQSLEPHSADSLHQFSRLFASSQSLYNSLCKQLIEKCVSVNSHNVIRMLNRRTEELANNRSWKADCRLHDSCHSPGPRTAQSAAAGTKCLQLTAYNPCATKCLITYWLEPCLDTRVCLQLGSGSSKFWLKCVPKAIVQKLGD